MPKWKVKQIFQGAYRLSGTGIVECLEIIDVGCNLKQFDCLTWLTLTDSDTSDTAKATASTLSDADHNPDFWPGIQPGWKSLRWSSGALVGWSLPFSTFKAMNPKLGITLFAMRGRCNAFRPVDLPGLRWYTRWTYPRRMARLSWHVLNPVYAAVGYPTEMVIHPNTI